MLQNALSVLVSAFFIECSHYDITFCVSDINNELRYGQPVIVYSNLNTLQRVQEIFDILREPLWKAWDELPYQETHWYNKALGFLRDFDVLYDTVSDLPDL